MKKPSSVAVLPFPLTAAALFGYGILRFLGYINENTHTRFTRVSSPHIALFVGQGKIISLHGDDLYPKINERIGGKADLRRIFNFGVFGGGSQYQTKATYSRLTSALQKLNTSACREALKNVYEFTAMLMGGNTDIWKSVQILEHFIIALESLEKPSVVATHPLGISFASLPVFKQHNGIVTDGNVIKSFKVPLTEGRIFDLENKHICLSIGGPKGSGKSTLAPSLVEQMQICIDSLKSHPDFSKLQLDVVYTTLDLGTPTGPAIVGGWADNREKVRAMKQPWTEELAERTQQEFLQSRAKNNITIGDLPGRITEITELLAGSTDVGIVISNDWGLPKTEWCEFMSALGLPIVSRIKSQKATEGSSLVTNWRKGEQLNGRITELNRFRRSSDPFIQWLAPFLLFDILPTQFEAGS